MGGHLPRPLGVIESIERRLAGLSAPAQSLVQVAAVAGADFSVKLAEVVLAHDGAVAGRGLARARGGAVDRRRRIRARPRARSGSRMGSATDPAPSVRRDRGLSRANEAASRRGSPISGSRQATTRTPRRRSSPPPTRRAAPAASSKPGNAASRPRAPTIACGRDAQAFEQLYRAFDDLSTTGAARSAFERLAARARPARARRRAAARWPRSRARRSRTWLASGVRWKPRSAKRSLRRSGAAITRLEAEARFGLGVLLHYRGEFTESIEQIVGCVQLLGAAGSQCDKRRCAARSRALLYLVGRVGRGLRRARQGDPGPARRQRLRAKWPPISASGHCWRSKSAILPRRSISSRQSCSLLGEAEAGPHEWLTVMGDRLRVLATASRYDEALDLIASVRTRPALRAGRRRRPGSSKPRRRFCSSSAAAGRPSACSSRLPRIDGGVAGYRGSRAVLALHGQSLQARPVAADKTRPRARS